MLDINKVKISASLPDLLKGKVFIDKIYIHQPDLKQIAFSGKIKHKNTVTFLQENFKQLIDSIFDFIPSDQPSLEIEFKDFKSNYFEKMNGHVIFNNKDAHLNCNIYDIKYSTSEFPSPVFKNNIDLETIQMDQLNFILKIDTDLKMNGQFSGKNLKIWSENDTLLVDTNKIHTQFFISKEYTKIDITPLNLSTPQGRVGVHFSHDIPLRSSILLFSGSNIDIVQANNMSKILFRGHKIPTNIFQVVHQGTVRKVDVSFKSRSVQDLFHEDNFMLRGNLSNGVVLIPETNIFAKAVEGNVIVKNQKLLITSDKAMIDGNILTDADLLIDLSKDMIPFKGEFSLDLDLSTIPGVLISLLPNTMLARELSHVSNTIGEAKATLTLAYLPDNQTLDVGIETENFSVQGNYDRIPGDIFLDSVNFNLGNNIITLAKFNGEINGNLVSDMAAEIDINNNFLTIDSGSGSGDVSKIIPWLRSFETTRKLISPVVSGSGKLSIASTNISGPIFNPDKWEYDIKGSGVGINLTTHNNQKEIENINFKYHATQTNSKLTDISLKISNLDGFESQFDKRQYNSIILPLVMKNATLEQTGPQSRFNGTFIFGPETSVQFNLKGKTLRALDLEKLIFKDSNATNCTLSLNKEDSTTQFDFHGLLNFNSLKKLIAPSSFLEKQINEITDNQPVTIHSGNESNLDIIIKTLNLSSSFQGSKQAFIKNKWLSKKNIRLKSDQVIYKRFVLKDLDSNLRMDNKNYDIKINHVKLCDLSTTGAIQINDQNVKMNFPFNASDQENIQPLLSCLFNANDFMDGTYSIQTTVSSTGTRSNVIHNFEGNLKFDSFDGRIHKLTLLSRILSVLNVSEMLKGTIPDISQTGFAYNHIDIDSEIKDSKIILKNAVIDGKDMTLIFMGWVDPVNDKIDLTCLIAPFKSIDIIIKKIPIVNTLLKGRLISVPVQATGSLSNPVVVPLHPSAVGSNLIKRMTDIVQTPIRLLDKLSDEDSTN